MPLGYLIFVSTDCMSYLGYVEDLVQSIFAWTKIFLTNVVWINVANSLDYFISVSIGCLPDFSSLGYVEDLVQNIFTGTTFPEKNAIEKLVHIKFWSNLFHQDKKG